MMKLLTITFLVALAAVAIAEDAGTDAEGSGSAADRDNGGEKGQGGMNGPAGGNGGGMNGPAGGNGGGMNGPAGGNGGEKGQGPDQSETAGHSHSHTHGGKSKSASKSKLAPNSNPAAKSDSKSKSAKSAKSPKKAGLLLESQVAKSSFGAAGAITLVAGLSFVAIRKYRKSGYTLAATDEAAANLEDPSEATPLVL